MSSMTSSFSGSDPTRQVTINKLKHDTSPVRYIIILLDFKLEQKSCFLKSMNQSLNLFYFYNEIRVVRSKKRGKGNPPQLTSLCNTKKIMYCIYEYVNIFITLCTLSEPFAFPPTLHTKRCINYNLFFIQQLILH